MTSLVSLGAPKIDAVSLAQKQEKLFSNWRRCGA
jgi:hypothetical protein